jgi:hypothetical protein
VSLGIGAGAGALRYDGARAGVHECPLFLVDEIVTYERILSVLFLSNSSVMRIRSTVDAQPDRRAALELDAEDLHPPRRRGTDDCDG